MTDPKPGLKLPLQVRVVPESDDVEIWEADEQPLLTMWLGESSELPEYMRLAELIVAALTADAEGTFGCFCHDPTCTEWHSADAEKEPE